VVSVEIVSARTAALAATNPPVSARVLLVISGTMLM
jgi:hypothetical protein